MRRDGMGYPNGKKQNKVLTGQIGPVSGLLPRGS
jgi:hypothetical protein